MTQKFHRLLPLAMSLIMILSVGSINVSAEDHVYKVGDTVTRDTKDAELPVLSNPAFTWEGPEVLIDKTACGKEEHTHSTDTCSYRKAENGETADFSKNIYYVWKENPNDPSTYIWVECTKEEYDKASHTLQVYTDFVWTCGKEAHTHTEECSKITGYKWTVTKSNLNEHTIWNHIKVNFTNVQDGMSVSDVTVSVTYADGTVTDPCSADSTEDDNGLIFKGCLPDYKYAFISNDTYNKSDNRIVGVEISYTYDGVTSTYSVDSFGELEAARLACPKNQWNTNGLDFTIQVGSASRYYSRVVENYYLDDVLVKSIPGDVIESRDDSVTITPETTSTYDGNVYSLDTNSKDKYTKVDISASVDDASKAVDVVAD